jgi:tRNA A37 threonylcarbamoyladenosine dehydratase
MLVTPVANTTDVQIVDFSQSFKKASDCARYVMGFGPFGTSSVVNAAKRAGIKKVEVVDYQTKWNPFVYQECVVAYGN